MNRCLPENRALNVISEDKLDRFDSWFEDFDEEEQVLLEQIESGALE